MQTSIEEGWGLRLRWLQQHKVGCSSGLAVLVFAVMALQVSGDVAASFKYCRLDAMHKHGAMSLEALFAAVCSLVVGQTASPRHQRCLAWIACWANHFKSWTAELEIAETRT